MIPQGSTWRAVMEAISNKHNLVCLAVFCLVCFFVLAQGESFAQQEREDCSICGMWIDLYMKTRHEITLNGGASEDFCSISCASKYFNKHRSEVHSVMVSDYITEELIDAHKAFYLSGSDIHGVMTYTSRIAFPSRSKAVEFQKEHGGTIINFEQALSELNKQ